jgi:hypothetical protein
MGPKNLTIGQGLLGICLCIVAIVLAVKGFTLLALLVVPYVLPTLCAAFYTKKKDWWLICLFNIFLGLTGIGWIIAFIWAAKPDAEDVIRGSPKLQAVHAEVRAMRDSAVRQALARAVRTGLPEDQELLNAKVAEYRAKYGALPHAITEALESQEEARRGAQVAQEQAREAEKVQRTLLLREADALEKQYWEKGDATLLRRINELRQGAGTKRTK